eukprot:g42080.t1
MCPVALFAGVFPDISAPRKRPAFSRCSSQPQTMSAEEGDGAKKATEVTTVTEEEVKVVKDKEAHPRDETEPTKKEAAVIQQCEFYFSDSNLPNDKFLKNLTKEGGGWVSLKTIACFKRIKTLLPVEDDDSRAKELAAALRKSKALLLVSIDDLFVKRATPLPQEARFIQQKRSLAVEGLPGEGVSIESMNEFFTKAGAAVRCVRLQRTKTDKKEEERKFAGVAFVEVDDEAQATAFLSKELTWPGGEKPLQLSSLEEYFKKHPRKNTGDKGDKVGKAEKGGKEKEGGKGKKRKDPEGEEGKEGEEGNEEDSFVKDRFIKVGNLEDSDLSREAIKSFVEQHGGVVAFIQYSRGEAEAFVRLDKEPTENTASSLAKKIVEAKTELAGKVRSVVALQGEEEVAYNNKIQEFKRARKVFKGKKGGKAHRGGHHKRQKRA